MLESELRINVLSQFELLTNKIATLCEAILADTPLIAWMQDLETLPTAQNLRTHREKACAIIQQLEYLDHQAPREILISAGFLGASPRTLQLANELNQEKLNFKQAVLSLKDLKISLKEHYFSDNMNSILKKRPSIVSQNLQPVGLSRIHLKQCYRQIPILSHPPQKISWTWAHTRSIKKISVQMADKLLSQKGMSESIELQRKRLHMLSPNASLAIIQELAPHLRANIVYTVEHQIKRMMIKGPMPILFPASLETPYPQFKPPKEKQQKNKNRVIRSDVKIDPEPYLTAIRAHRYL